MKTIQLIICILFMASAYSYTQNFEKYFEDAVMRVDYHHTGNAKEETFSVDRIYRYNKWGRSFKNLTDNFNNGKYYIKVYSLPDKILLYSKGFDSYFGEYQTSGKALEGIKKSYHETAVIPFPKQKVLFTIEKRNRNYKFDSLFEEVIDPSEVNIIAESLNDPSVEVIKSFSGGDPSVKVDVVILAEGYTAQERDKFVRDLDRFTGYFFENEPYKTLKQSFNIYGVFKPSVETGTDEPPAGIFRNTVLNSTFNSLGSERYLLTEDNKAVRDLAAYAPYDAIYIMVNHKKYGGGGIYNFFCTFSADAQFSKYLFIHEFGHSFAGLADEYYTSSTAYNEFYPLGVEPNEPNITALPDKNNLKWKESLTPGIELPTPWEKEEFDKMDIAWQKDRAELNTKIAQMKRENADPGLIKAAEIEYAKKDRKNAEVVDQYLKSSKYAGMTGAFEGAGYISKGMFRPMLDCIMFSKGDKPFCKVCGAHIAKVIRFYTE